MAVFSIAMSRLMVDLNCDMGELDDAAREATLMEFVSSANIACGGHAGNEITMDRTARLALGCGVRIGAHPGYPDPANFGRVAMILPPGEIERTVIQQIRRLEEVVDRVGGRIEHVKPHGALYNVAARDAATAQAVGRAVLAWNPGTVLFALAGSPAQDLWRAMGLNVAAEAFADRRYEPDGCLRSRKLPDALITDPDEAAAQALRFARTGAVQTICVHSDTPNSAAILRACRDALS